MLPNYLVRLRGRTVQGGQKCRDAGATADPADVI
jgi:hypothetical protein